MVHQIGWLRSAAGVPAAFNLGVMYSARMIHAFFLFLYNPLQ